MLRNKLGMAAVLAVLSLFSLGTQAQTKGALTCPKGKVEAKSFAASYVPAKNSVTLFFYKDALSEDELDAQMAERSKFVAGDKAKGPGTGKPSKYAAYVFKLWTTIDTKPGQTANFDEIVKRAYFSYSCDDSSERVVHYDSKDSAAKMKAAFPTISVELKQGGKITLTSKGAWDGDPKDKDRIKASWDLQGTGKVRVYE